MNLRQQLTLLLDAINSPAHKETLSQAIAVVKNAEGIRSEWVRIPWGGRVLRSKIEGVVMADKQDQKAVIVSVMMDGRAVGECPSQVALGENRLSDAKSWLADIEAQLDGASSAASSTAESPPE